MSRPRLLALLLLISWTLNVALVVALFSRHREPRFPFPMGGGPRGMMSGAPPAPLGGLLPPEEFEAMRMGAAPLFAEQRRLGRELFAELTGDQLDSARVRRISDSLGAVRCRMQDMMVSRIAGLHDRLTSEQREAICGRMMWQLERNRPGRGERKPNG